MTSPIHSFTHSLCLFVVGRSKLDPKLTVNNRLLALEDTIRVMSEVINAHHRALDAVPTKITKAVPVDIKNQLVRLSNVIDRLDSGTFIKPSAARSIHFLSFFVLFVYIHSSHHSLTCHSQTISQVKSSSSEPPSPEKKVITEDTINEIVQRVLQAIPPPIEPKEVNIRHLLTNEEIERIAKIMISEGYFDEFRQTSHHGKVSRKSTTHGDEDDEDNEPVTKAEINEMLENALNAPLHISIPTNSENEIAPRTSYSSPSSAYSPIRTQLMSGGVNGAGHLSSTPSFKQHHNPHSNDSYSGTPLDSSRSHYHPARARFSEKFQQALSTHFQQNTQQYATHDELNHSIKLSHHQMDNELQRYFKSQKIEQDTSTYMFNEKTDRLEKNFLELQQIVNTIDINLKKHISSALLKDKQSEAEINSKGDWRPEIERVNADIAKSMNDHKELAKAVSVFFLSLI